MTNTISARDASILGLIARAKPECKDAARNLITGMELEAEHAALLILGDISETEVSERSKLLAKTAMDWVNARKE